MEKPTEQFERIKTIGLLLQEAASLTRREFERAARPEGLTLTQWRVLATLGKHPDGLRQTALGCAINASPMTISDVAERLEAAGLISRGPDPDDSRAKRMEMTAEGEAVLLRMRSIAGEILDIALAGLEESAVAQLSTGLRRIVENLQDRPGT